MVEFKVQLDWYNNITVEVKDYFKVILFNISPIIVLKPTYGLNGSLSVFVGCTNSVFYIFWTFQSGNKSIPYPQCLGSRCMYTKHKVSTDFTSVWFKKTLNWIEPSQLVPIKARTWTEEFQSLKNLSTPRVCFLDSDTWIHHWDLY